ncbi:MAG: hypothetical protein ACXQTY_07535 [Candidatus Methanogasteraceae archaeon]
MRYTVHETSITTELGSDGKTRIFTDDQKTGSFEDLSKILKMSKRDLEDISIYIPNDTKTLNEYANHLSSIEMKIVKSGATKHVAEFVNQCIDENYTKVLWKREGLSCRKELPDGSLLYPKLNDLGEGIKRATIVMLLLEQ